MNAVMLEFRVAGGVYVTFAPLVADKVPSPDSFQFTSALLFSTFASSAVAASQAVALMLSGVTLRVGAWVGEQAAKRARLRLESKMVLVRMEVS